MADVSVKAVSPRITLDLDLIEAKAVLAQLTKDQGFGPNKLSSVRSELQSGITSAEAIVAGVSYAQEK